MSDLRCLVMLDGTVFGNVQKAASRPPMEIRLGDALSPFESCSEDLAEVLRQPSRIWFDTHQLAETSHSLPVEETPGEVYACWVNHLQDWTLSGSQTIQLMINRYEVPCQIFFDQRMHVPRVKPGMAFRACLAAHRAAATLCVTFQDPVSLQQERHFIAFDTQHPGGTLRQGYAEVIQPLPASFQSCNVTLEIEYRGHQPDTKGTEPFLFLADVQVADPEAVQDQILLEPEWLYGAADQADGEWLRAPLPNALVPGQSLAVQMGAEVLPIPPLARAHFNVRENYGHTLVCEAGRQMELVLAIDGTHVTQLRITPGDNIIRIPPRYLSGHVRLITLQDRSGSVTHFEQHQMMPYIVTPEDVMRRESAAPFPDALLPQTARRYGALKATLAHAGPATNFQQLAHALETLEGGPENVKRKPLRFPQVKDPDVSIIMPAHNNFDFTYLALCSLLMAHNDASFEVIIVDDASTDETAYLGDLVTGVTVVRHPVAQRFIRACNAGAERARGRYIALLNNDVEVTAHWLDELLAAFKRFDNVGLVGAKLLYPTGELQDAGGIIWGSGNPWNYGNGQNPNDPRYCYARQADYLSGAALLAPAEVWQEVGGLSSYLEPMYFEDTDLAFKVRAAGYATWFIPSSVIYHFEGTTSGTDTSEGFKRYQEVNRPKFKRRWASAYAPNGTEGHRPDLEKDRGISGRILFIDHAPPRPDKDAGSYAAWQEIKLVQSLGYKVSFISTNMAHLGSYTEALQKQGVEVIYAPFFMNAGEYLDAHAGDFDAFYITRYYVAQTVLEQIRSLAPDAKVLFNNADLHFLRELRAARSEGSEAMMERARKTRQAELEVISKVDVVLSYNDVEHSVIQAYSDGAARVVKCPWVVEVPDAVPSAASRRGLSFLGSFHHHPNTEGITWFAQTIMPHVISRMPHCKLTIYGSGMGDQIRGLASHHVIPHGFVDDAGEAYAAHRVFVAPLRSGAGIKGKVLSALAHGIPCVISPIAAEGIGLRSGHDCMIAETPEDWLEAIVTLSRDDGLWEDISQNARSYMHSAYSFEKGRGLMRTAFEAAELYGVRP